MAGRYLIVWATRETACLPVHFRILWVLNCTTRICSAKFSGGKCYWTNNWVSLVNYKETEMERKPVYWKRLRRHISQSQCVEFICNFFLKFVHIFMFIYSHRSPGCTCPLPLPQRVLGLNVRGKALISRLYFGVHWAEIKPQSEWQSMLSVRCGFTGSTKIPAPTCTSQHIWKEVKLHHWNSLLSLKDLLPVVLHCFSNLFLSHTKFLCVIAWKWSYESYFQILIFYHF